MLSYAVLFEDEHVLAVDKPSGLAVIPERTGDPEQCLRKLIEAERSLPLWVVHRIDRDTSGVVLFAKTADAHRTMCMTFESRAVEKTYVVLVNGALLDELTISCPLHAARKNKVRAARQGEDGAQLAETRIAVLQRWRTPLGEVAYVEAHPVTGRRHQIRVHLRFAGAALLFDPWYGGRVAITGERLGRNGTDVLCDRLTLTQYSAPSELFAVRAVYQPFVPNSETLSMPRLAHSGTWVSCCTNVSMACAMELSLMRAQAW